MIADVVAVAVSIALFAIASLHVYWAFGGRWPGRDEASLTAAVVGTPDGMRMPSFLACIGVAVGLAAMAVGPLAVRGLVSPPLPTLVRVLTWLAAAVLAVRGTAGYLVPRLRAPGVEPFARLNRLVY